MGNISGSAIHLHLERNSIDTTTSGSDEAELRHETAAAAGGEDDDNGRVRNRHRHGPVMNYSDLLVDKTGGKRRMTAALTPPKGAAFTGWSADDVAGAVRHHPVPCVFALSLLFFMGVEYTLRMVPFDSPPLDIGFLFTQAIHGFIAARPALNSALAALNTVFVVMQTTYILWTLLVEGRPRPAIAALFMFTCRGILGYTTQLPLPQDFLGSGMDFPVGNVSFFLFFSGHVAGAVIASLDMRRLRRHRLAWTFDALNTLQGLRLLATRGHYTIDLAVGVGAGMLFDTLAGKYEESKNHASDNHRQQERTCSGCSCSCR